jgi:hypothetical protein
LPKLTLELDEGVRLGTCVRCGTQFPFVHGFVYRDGDAFAVYWAELYKDHPEHPEAHAVLAIAVGDDWWEGAEPGHRAWAQLDIWTDNDEIRMGFIDPIAHHDEAHFGLSLSRENVLLDSRKDAFLKVAEEISFGDPRVSALLGTTRRS